MLKFVDYVHAEKQKLNPSVWTVELLRRLGIGTRALSMHGQALAMSDSLVASDIDLHLDVSEHLVAELRLELKGGELGSEGHDLRLVQLVHTHLWIKPELGTHLIGSFATHAEELEAQAFTDESVSAETLAHNCGHHGEKNPNPTSCHIYAQTDELVIHIYRNNDK